MYVAEAAVSSCKKQLIYWWICGLNSIIFVDICVCGFKWKLQFQGYINSLSMIVSVQYVVRCCTSIYNQFCGSTQ